jgi:hypothetical protein
MCGRGYLDTVSTNGQRLDSLGRRGYKPALVFMVWALGLAAIPARAATPLHKGAILPGGAPQVGEDRFRSPSNFVDTKLFYDKQYRTNPRKSIINQPGIRAYHIVNDSKTGDWEGLNIYELDGETRIYVVSRDPQPKPTTEKAAGADGGKAADKPSKSERQ